MKLLDGKNVVITGASRGIGRGIALVFAKHGANIAFTYLSSKEAAIAFVAASENSGPPSSDRFL